jgi:uncharacterized protein (TIRG00374 family)
LAGSSISKEEYNVMKRKVKIFIKYLIGIFIMIYIIWHYDAYQILHNLLSISSYWLGVILLFWFVIMLTKAILWKIYLSAVNIQLPLSSSLRAILIASLIGRVLPVQISSFSRPLYLKSLKTKYSLADLTATIVVEQFLTVISYFFILLSGILILALLGVNKKVFIVLNFILFLYIFICLLFILFLKEDLFRKFNNLNKYIYKISYFFLKPIAGFKKKLRLILKQKFVVIKGLGLQLIINTLLNGVMFWFLFNSLNIKATFSALFILLISISFSLAIVPISPNGIGIVEWMAVLLFTNILRYPGGEIISVFLLYRFVNIGMSFLAGGGCYLWPIKSDTHFQQKVKNEQT